VKPGRTCDLGRAAVAAALAFLVLLGAAGPLRAQCAMCQSVVAQSPEAQFAARQLNLAILVLFFAPYILIAGFAFLMFREPIVHRLRSRIARLRASSAPRLRALPR
jgi:hypothetical protein